jgi:hypothetical protein
MSFDPHSSRFNPRWLLPTMEINAAETFEAPDVFRFSSAEESTNDPVGREFDEALEQIASERGFVCPRCRAIVASDGSAFS